MSMKLIAGAAAAMALALPVTTANAASYFSYLEYKNSAPNTQVAPFGKVTLTELSANSVDVLVELYAPQLGFLNSGGGNKAPFTFNLTGDYDVEVFNPLPGQQFEDGGYGNFQNNNFGFYTNRINCCDGKNGGGHYDPTNLHFIVTNTAPGGTLTFAGVGATFDGGGRLLTSGTGPRFFSTVDDPLTTKKVEPVGYWFSADVYNGAANDNTFNIAARDAFRTAVPEPATWALMILGFGSAGAMLRRRRSAFA